MKVEIDHDLCIGDGICSDICPEVFEMHDDNLAYLKVEGDVAASLEDGCKEACEACPVEAIKLS